MFLMRLINSCAPFCSIEKIKLYMLKTYPYEETTPFILVWANKKHPQSATAILENLEYNHLRSGKNIDFFFPGYVSSSKQQDKSSFDWEFRTEDFVESIKTVEDISKWKYSGETEFLFLEYEKGNISFKNTISINIDRLLRNNIIESVPSFVEELIRVSEYSNKISDFSFNLNYLEAEYSAKKSIKEYLISMFNGVHTGAFCHRNLEK